MQKTYTSPGTVSSPYKQNLLNIQKWQLYASKSDSIKILRLGAGKVWKSSLLKLNRLLGTAISGTENTRAWWLALYTQLPLSSCKSYQYRWRLLWQPQACWKYLLPELFSSWCFLPCHQLPLLTKMQEKKKKNQTVTVASFFVNFFCCLGFFNCFTCLISGYSPHSYSTKRRDEIQNFTICWFVFQTAHSLTL